MNRKADIVIPIYAGAQEVLECVESVFRHSGDSLGKLILANDCSPYRDIQALMKKFEAMAEDNDQIVVINNPSNLGYLCTCNMAYAYTTEDVVFLNSDTVVTAGWLSKIMHCAYRDPKTGIVSPLTNSGMLCSVPVIGKDNRLPNGMTLDGYAAMIERSSLQRYPITPSAFGFCMFVKRSVMDAVGLFDEAFGQGYYEENDLCCRARRNGWTSAICDDTYIYHYGSISFSKRKNSISLTNREQIQKKYPYILSELSQFDQAVFLRDIHTNIYLHTRLRQKSSRTVLHILHKSPFEDAAHIRGGVEYHVLDLIERTKSEMNAFALYPDDSQCNTGFTLRGYAGGVETTFHFDMPTPMLSEMQWNPDIGRLYHTVLAALQVEAVHIHHLFGHTWQIADCCAQMRIPYFVTLHDLHLLCPRYWFQMPDETPCGADQNPERCQMETCFGGESAAGPAYLEAYRSGIKSRLEGAQHVFAPSEYIRKTYQAWYGAIPCRIIPHWPPAYEMPDMAQVAQREDEAMLNVAVLGAVTPTKGSTLLCELLDKGLPYVRWHLFGALGDPCVLAFEGNRAVIHGEYKRTEIIRLLVHEKIDVVCLLSKINESYGYTLSEAWLAKCPVICTPSGAICERVQKTGGGWVASDAKEIISLLSAIHRDNELIREKRAKIPEFSKEQYNALIQQYITIYHGVSSPGTSSSNPEANRALLKAWVHSNPSALPAQKSPFILQLAKLYYDDGTGYCEEHHLQALITLERDFSLVFQFSTPTACRSVRFDIVDGYQTQVRIDNAVVHFSDGSAARLEAFAHNGAQRGDMILFETDDPNILWNTPDLAIVSVEIRGVWHIELNGSPVRPIAAPSAVSQPQPPPKSGLRKKAFHLARRIRYKLKHVWLKAKQRKEKR